MANEVVSADLQSWFETPLGAYLLAFEQQYFDQEVADVFGFNALQVGFNAHDFLRANRMPLHCRVSDVPAPSGAEPQVLDAIPVDESDSGPRSTGMSI